MKIEVPGSGTVTAVPVAPRGDAGWTFVYAPGAGSNVHDPFGTHLCDALAARGVACLRIQFPYMEEGRRSPDRPAVLEATWRAAIAAARSAGGGRLCIGGRSMGGRIASMVAAADATPTNGGAAPADAVALFAYPLHPPGKPEQRRDAHLPSLRARTLFVSGTNDAFAAPAELAQAAALVPSSRIHLLEGADHGFSVRKGSGRTRAEVWAEAVEAMAAWLLGP